MTFLIIFFQPNLYHPGVVLILHLNITSATLTIMSYNSPQSNVWNVLVLMCILTTALDSEGSSSSTTVTGTQLLNATRRTVFPHRNTLKSIPQYLMRA
jgi:hypothetical protein